MIYVLKGFNSEQDKDTINSQKEVDVVNNDMATTTVDSGKED